MNSIIYNPVTQKYKVYIDFQDESNIDCGGYDTLLEAQREFENNRTNTLGCCQHEAQIIYLKHPEDRMRELEERVAKLERRIKKCLKK